MLSKVIGHHQRSPHFLQLLCEPWTPYFLLYFGQWKSITKLTSKFHGCHGQSFLKFPDVSMTFSWQNVKFPWPTEQTIHPLHPYIYNAFSKACAVCMNGYFLNVTCKKEWFCWKISLSFKFMNNILPNEYNLIHVCHMHKWILNVTL